MSSSRFLLSIATSGLVALAACSSSTDQPPAAGSSGTTAQPPAPPTGTGTPDGQPPITPPTPPTDGGVNPGNGMWGPAKCPALPAGKQSGVATGQQIPQITVKDADGNDYTLNNVCGADATYLFVAHAWCPYCQQATKASEALLATYAGKNVAFVNVLVANSADQAPTLAECKAWRETYKLTNVIALCDTSGATKPLFDAGSSALGVYMDKDRVIKSKTIHTSDPTAIKAGIDGALAP